MNFKSTLAGLALCVVSAAASAAPWTQTIDFNPDVYIGPNFTWTHDLTTAGFVAGLDTVTGFSLSVQIADDASDPRFFPAETGFLDVHSSLFSDRILLSPIGTSTTTGDIFALFDLNADGTLGVTLSSTLGDFVLQAATLSATGTDGPRSAVPEPGVLALAGLGLLGVGLSRRKKSA